MLVQTHGRDHLYSSSNYWSSVYRDRDKSHGSPTFLGEPHHTSFTSNEDPSQKKPPCGFASVTQQFYNIDPS